MTIWERRTRTTRQLELQGMADWRIAGVRGAVTMPRWAPDNQQFILHAVRKVSGSWANPVLVYALFLVDAATGEVKQVGTEVPEDQKALDLCWRPDGRAVTYVSGPRRLTTLSLDGGRVAWNDLQFPGPAHLRLGNYTSDGEWLLVTADDKDRNGRGNRDVWVLPHLQGTAKRLTQTAGMDAYPTWSPDDREVYFVSGGASERNDTWGIWKIGLARKSRSPQGAPTEVFARKGEKILQWKEGLEWHPSSEYLTYMIYGPERFSSQIRRAYPDGRPTELMIQQQEHWDYLGVWAPDGRRFYFNSSERNPDQVVIHLYDAQTQQITHDHSGGKLDALPRWSRDGSTATWTSGEAHRYFEEIEGFIP